MLKKLCVTGCVVAAAAGVTLLSSPAYADTRVGNSSRNEATSQSGNNFHNIGTSNIGSTRSTNVNNINGLSTTANNRSRAVTVIEFDD